MNPSPIQYKLIPENVFTLGCPQGYNYDWTLNRCNSKKKLIINNECIDNDNMPYYTGNSWYRWNFKNDIVNDMKD